MVPVLMDITVTAGSLESLWQTLVENMTPITHGTENSCHVPSRRVNLSLNHVPISHPLTTSPESHICPMTPPYPPSSTHQSHP
jgi:hypothetical protein